MTSPLADARTPGRTLLVGYGKLAARLVPALVASEQAGAGARVFALRRSDAALPPGVVGITADVSGVIEALPAVDSMVVTLPPGEHVDGYRTALASVAAALPRTPDRTIFVSSTGVFAGAAPDRVLTESDEPLLDTDRARALRDGEHAAVEFFDAVVLRPAGIYGPGRDFLVRRVRDQAPVDHRRWTNRIHETDLVRALDALLRMPRPPRLLHAVDERPVILGEVVEYIARRLGMQPPPDLGAAAESGHILDGALFCGVLGELEHPTFESGYDAMLS